MIDLTAIAGAAAGVRAAGELVTSILNAKGGGEVTAKANELNAVIHTLMANLFEVRNTLSVLQDENRELKDKATQYENHQGDMQRYQLVRPHVAGVLYAVKRNMSNGEAAHYVCPNCHQLGRKSILQCAPTPSGFFAFTCPNCKTSILTETMSAPPVRYAEDIAS